MPNLKAFSLYLAKPDVRTFDALLTDNARALLKAGEVRTHTSTRRPKNGSSTSAPS
jgi:hypothetical protein